MLNGDYNAAREAFGDELIVAQANLLKTFYFEGLLGFAALAAHDGADERAAALEAAAWHHNDRPVHVSERPVYDRVEHRFLIPARQRLGQEAWAQASKRGRRLDAGDAISLAPERAAAQSTHSSSSSTDASGVTEVGQSTAA